eukprot:TRINITY_DN2787_c1_g1_i12.p4 TRINITY_DN2787_c1_g1~~TRINITY_DN2787_c1_g1_i12.p4  ORF type:complete len:102 (-),score=2.50 TRINITY_DN2787_c1_g1_i12:393-698(-)
MQMHREKLQIRKKNLNCNNFAATLCKLMLYMQSKSNTVEIACNEVDGSCYRQTSLYEQHIFKKEFQQTQQILYILREYTEKTPKMAIFKPISQFCQKLLIP